MTAIESKNLEWCDENCFTHSAASGKVRCGCGSDHDLRWTKPGTIVHCDGKHWNVHCLLERLLTRRQEDGKTIELFSKRMNRVLDDISQVKCICTVDFSNPVKVGRNYVLENGVLLCPDCGSDSE